MGNLATKCLDHVWSATCVKQQGDHDRPGDVEIYMIDKLGGDRVEVFLYGGQPVSNFLGLGTSDGASPFIYADKPQHDVRTNGISLPSQAPGSISWIDPGPLEFDPRILNGSVLANLIENL